MKPTMGRIRRESPRYETWTAVFGAGAVELESPVAATAWSPEGARKEFYKVRVASLTPEQRARLVPHLCARFQLEPAEVERSLDDPEHGLPVLAEDLTVSFSLLRLVT